MRFHHDPSSVLPVDTRCVHTVHTLPLPALSHILHVDTPGAPNSPGNSSFVVGRTRTSDYSPGSQMTQILAALRPTDSPSSRPQYSNQGTPTFEEGARNNPRYDDCPMQQL